MYLCSVSRRPPGREPGSPAYRTNALDRSAKELTPFPSCRNLLNMRRLRSPPEMPHTSFSPGPCPTVTVSHYHDFSQVHSFHALGGGLTQAARARSNLKRRWPPIHHCSNGRSSLTSPHCNVSRRPPGREPGPPAYRTSPLDRSAKELTPFPRYRNLPSMRRLWSSPESLQYYFYIIYARYQDLPVMYV